MEYSGEVPDPTPCQDLSKTHTRDPEQLQRSSVILWTSSPSCLMGPLTLMPRLSSRPLVLVLSPMLMGF